MDTTVTLDSFQLIIGLYLLYVAIKGQGTLYRFFDLPERQQERVHGILRRIYALCGVLALTEAVLCMVLGTAYPDSETLRAGISLGCSGLIILILAATFVWLRKLANKE